MKKLLISFSCAWLALAANAPSTVLAQSVEWTSVPLLLGMQGRLVASNGAPMTGVKTLSFNLYAAPTEGTALWSESQTLALTNGFYAAFLGAVTGLDASLFNGKTLYVGVTVDGTELLPRQQIGTVAYALVANQAIRAVNADHATSADRADRATSATSATSATTAGYATSAGTATSAGSAGSAGSVDTTWLTGRMNSWATSATVSRATSADSTIMATSVGVSTTPLDHRGDVYAKDVFVRDLTASGDIAVRGMVVGGGTVSCSASSCSCSGLWAVAGHSMPTCSTRSVSCPAGSSYHAPFCIRN